MQRERSRGVSGIFIVCDTEKEYAEQLFRILSERLGGIYQFHLFHDVGKMEEYLENSYAEVLLLGEEYEKRSYRRHAPDKR